MITATQAYSLLIDSLQAKSEQALSEWLLESKVEDKIKTAAGAGYDRLVFEMPRTLWLDADPWFKRLGYTTHFGMANNKQVSVTISWAGKS